MKRVNQILAVLLTLLMIVTAVPFAAFAAGETTTTDPRTPEQTGKAKIGRTSFIPLRR